MASSAPSLSFSQKIDAARARANGSLLCLGLDPPLGKFSGEDELVDWGISLVRATADVICCVKPQIAFYEAMGWRGMRALERTMQAIPKDLPVILDCKRGDIGTTAEAYAEAYLSPSAFAGRPADATTLSPYLGKDSVAPFLQKYPGSMGFLLCHTSNPGAAEIQRIATVEGQAIFEVIANRVASWGSEDSVGLVVGATVPKALKAVRNVLPNHWLLVPGVGAQGGTVKDVLQAVSANPHRVIIPVSRSILTSSDPRAAALAFNKEIAQELGSLSHSPVTSVPNLPSQLASTLERSGCLQYGDFTLASGKKSNFYIDLRLVPSDPNTFQAVTLAYQEILSKLRFDRIAGVPLGALPLASVLALKMGKPLVYPRKDVKDHGRSREIEGVYHPNERVCVIEDLATTGGSVLEAVTKLRNAGLIVEDVVVLVDRQQGASERLLEQGITLHSSVVVNSCGAFHASSKSTVPRAEDASVSLATEFGGIKFSSCLWNASGALCEMEDQLKALDSATSCGAVLTKTCTLEKRAGNPLPRWFCNDLLSINSMGLPNQGAEYYTALAKSVAFQKPLLMSTAGLSVDEAESVLRQVAETKGAVAGVEFNLSCPNVPGKPQIAYDPESMKAWMERAATVLSPAGIPWGVKLPPFFDVAHFKTAASVINDFASRGLAFVTCINSIGNALVIDPQELTTAIHPRDGFGGIGGKVIKPTALANVRMFRTLLAPSIAVIGCGGVETGQDAFEHILAGASAVQVGTELVKSGTGCFQRIAKELSELMASRGYSQLSDFRGSLKVRPSYD